jgi:hypothetical protein
LIDNFYDRALRRHLTLAIALVQKYGMAVVLSMTRFPEN